MLVLYVLYFWSKEPENNLRNLILNNMCSFLREGKYNRQRRAPYMCWSVYWGCACTVGFVYYMLWSKEPEKDLEDFKYESCRMYV